MNDRRTLLRAVCILTLAGLNIPHVSSECPQPGKIRHGTIHHLTADGPALESLPELYSIFYTCRPGHRLRGPEFRTCQADGTWTGDQPQCVARGCPKPEAPHRGFVGKVHGRRSRKFPVGSRIRYSCEPGFNLVGTSELECLDIYQWDGETPKCERVVHCPDPGVPAHGGRIGQDFQVGASVDFYCQVGYVLEGSAVRQCQDDQTWSGAVSVCRANIFCDDPGWVDNGNRTSPALPVFHVDDDVTYSCHDGYGLTGSANITCLQNGSWSDVRPSCQEVLCEGPEAPLNGEVHTLQTQNNPASLHNVTANQTDTGNSSVPLAVVSVTTTEEPLFENFSTPDTNITSVERILFRVGSTVKYSCAYGFELSGPRQRTCQHNSGWSGVQPTCEEVICSDPGSPENGRKVGGSYRYGDKVQFRCQTGYTLHGSAERWCAAGGRWNGTLTTCDDAKSYCINPGVPINGVKEGTSYNKGDVVKFRCKPGYDLVGSEERECLRSGFWSGEQPTCEDPNSFDSVGDILPRLSQVWDGLQLTTSSNNKSKHILDRFRTSNATRGRVLDLGFAGGLDLYFLFDASGSVGSDNFKIGLNFATALVKKVGVSAEPGGTRVGAFSFASDVTPHFRPHDPLVTTEQVVDAMQQIQYTKGGTATRLALKFLRESVIPEAVAELDRPDESKKALFLITDGKSNTGGDPSEEARKLREELGLEIYTIGISNDVSKTELASVASSPKREHMFTLKDYFRLEWLIDALTNHSVDYSKCGQAGNTKPDSRARIVGGQDANEGAWPWQAALYFRRGSRELFLCGGSLIAADWVLTAAHCFFNPITGLRLDDTKISVKLGVTNLDTDEFKPKVQYWGENEVTTYVHQDYRQPDTGIYDNDIALVHLVSRRATLDPYVRTVCLPCSCACTGAGCLLNSQNNEENCVTEGTELFKRCKYGVVTGWGHTKQQDNNRFRTKVSSQLQQVEVKLRKDEECTQNLRLSANHYTSNMFCAGDPEAQQDACKGDSGGPFMCEVERDDKTRCWVQLGIVSWGDGCAAEGRYGYYTHLPKLMPWVKDTIARHGFN
ncbi:complement factor B-like [Branchiostoma lanceolatum]|uniref:complement factor B-like n=1 Tax=Branchiostoma lanceolatum TaxID=7740 RepID=UPI00345409EC